MLFFSFFPGREGGLARGNIKTGSGFGVSQRSLIMAGSSEPEGAGKMIKFSWVATSDSLGFNGGVCRNRLYYTNTRSLIGLQFVLILHYIAAAISSTIDLCHRIDFRNPISWAKKKNQVFPSTTDHRHGSPWKNIQVDCSPVVTSHNIYFSLNASNHSAQVVFDNPIILVFSSYLLYVFTALPRLFQFWWTFVKTADAVNLFVGLFFLALPSPRGKRNKWLIAFFHCTGGFTSIRLPCSCTSMVSVVRYL